MHLTVDASREIDHQLNLQIYHIREGVRKAVSQSNRVSFLLVGGFARGEGGVIRQDDRWVPANDYDFELVTHHALPPDDLKKLGERMAEEIGIRWVHIENHTVKQLRRMKFTMYNYDLKYAGKHLDGDATVQAIIPEMDASKMPWREAEKQILTRTWSFIGAFSRDMMKRPLDDEEEFFLAEQLSKAILAMQDCFLIPQGLYSSSYRKRLENLVDADYPEELADYFKWATAFKLSPHTYEKSNFVDLLFDIKPLFLKTLLDLYSDGYKRPLKNWKEYEHIHFTNGYTLLKRAYFILVKQSPWYINYLNYTMGMIYLIDALERDRVRFQSLDRARYFFSRVKGCTDPGENWDELRTEALRLREQIW